MTKPKVINRKITNEEAQMCAAEAIHQIGNIQPHGFQLILDPDKLIIVQYSENIIDLLNQYAPDSIADNTCVLNSSIFDWLSLAEPSALKRLASDRTSKVELGKQQRISGSKWECTAYLAKSWISLEFIPTATEVYDNYTLISEMNRMVEILRQAQGKQEIFDTITRRFQEYTNFDRVMMYRFLPDWSGTVISEAVSAREQPKFLHLRFPADDIPEQARRLYCINKVRVFANTDAAPIPLTPQKLPDGEYLDQRHSLLRNMSDMHRAYLRNMGVKATLSLSIMVDNKLWGLIVFHHNTPKSPPNHIVSQLKINCELFSEIISSYLMPAIQIQRITHQMQIKTSIEKIFNEAKKYTVTDNLLSSVLKDVHLAAGYDYIGVSYRGICYICHKGSFNIFSEETVNAINDLFIDAQATEYQTYQLHQGHTPIPNLENMVGIHAIRSSSPADFLVFFGRDEVIKDVQWSGMPNTVNIVVKDNQRHLEPRSSFALWREQVFGQSEFWEEQDTRILEYFYSSCKDFTNVKNNELLMQKLKKNAEFDVLTDLANRAYFKTYIETLKQNEALQYISMMFIDLDNFKDINDFMGHETGDRLLITVAKRLNACSRPGDLVVRLGGDEFVLVYVHEQAQAVDHLAEKVVKQVSEPLLYNEHAIVITPSIGVINCEVHEMDFNEMLKRADIAMYTAKSKGKNGFHIFDERDQDAFNKKAILTLDLRDYIDSDEIELHFQAQCDFNKNLTAAEALARWKHPQFGYISPEVFIQIAEKNNLIKPITLKIFNKACEQLALWQKHKLTSNFETMAINISPSLLLDFKFDQEIMAILARYPSIKSQNIRLEITESIFMQNYELAIESLNSLRKQGFSISLDDFGTGYSSLNYLWKLPIDEVKIDKSFISNMAQDKSLFTMVESIIDLCKKLKLEVVAEGVESNVEFNILKGLGCDTCQGYFYSRPVPSNQFIETYINHANPTK